MFWSTMSPQQSTYIWLKYSNSRSRRMYQQKSSESWIILGSIKMANEPKWISIIFSEPRSIQTWLGNPRTQRAFEVNIWENHGTKWGGSTKSCSIKDWGWPSWFSLETNKKLWNITMFHGKTHYFYGHLQLNYGKSPFLMGKSTINHHFQ